MSKESKKAYDLAYQKTLAQISIRMSHEQKRLIEECAKSHNKSTRAFILDVIMKEINNGAEEG